MTQGTDTETRGVSRASEREGVILCVLAAAGFGSMAVLAKLAYAAGADVLTLLSVRFTIGAALLWAVAAYRGVARLSSRTAAITALTMGLLLYSAESGLYATALTHIDASLAELLMFSYPAVVVIAGILLGREPSSSRRLLAVGIATSGVALVLIGGSTGQIDPVGVGLTLAAALIYAGYVLSADAIAGQLHPLTFAALICTGAAISFTSAGASSGSLQLGALHPQAWLWIAVIAVASTTFAMSAFVAGVERLGAGRASIMSAFDPIVAVVTGAAVFGESLGPIQMLGGFAVIAAVLVLQMPAGTLTRRRSRIVCAPPNAPWEQVGSDDFGPPAQPSAQPSAGSLALVTAERR
ncbi:MAG TPA: DMT family transporter [Conexibacter sp.]|jgi:drug/metabolite transporter (DMT)-like permease